MLTAVWRTKLDENDISFKQKKWPIINHGHDWTYYWFNNLSQNTRVYLNDEQSICKILQSR